MKKVLGVAAIAVLGVVALASCKKDYKCTYNGVTVSECNGCDKDDKEAFETACGILGGSVSTK